MKKIEPRQAGFMAVLLIIGFGLLEGTGLAQQYSRSVKAASERPSMIDAFLPNPVNSTDELVSLLEKDRSLRQRYARHFNIPENRVIDFVKNTLIVDRLKTDRVVTNYCITRTGRIYPLRLTMKKGTKVWALRDGTPILRWACANPLSKRLPMTLSYRRPKLSPLPEVAGQKPQIVETVPQPEMPIVDTTIAALPVQEPIQANTENLVSPAPVVASASALTGSIPIPGGGVPLLPLTAVTIPLLGSLLHPSSGGGTNGGSTPMVPEPGTLLLLASSLPVVACLRFRGKRKG